MIKLSKIFLVIIILQLFILGILHYFFLLHTEPVRWIIDSFLYLLLVVILLKSKLKIDKIILLYIFLLLVNILSFVVNSNELIPMMKQVRFTFMGGVIYFLFMHVKLKKEYFEWLINLLFYVGYLQLPIVIIQLLTYNYYAGLNIPGFPAYIDCASGSIGYSETGILGIFLVILSIVKLQYGLQYGFTFKSIIQVVILFAPLGLINSDAQFIFVPIIFLSMLIINKKITKNTLKFLFLLFIISISVNQIVMYNWGGSRTIWRYAEDAIKKKIDVKLYRTPGTIKEGRLLRHESMYSVWEQDTQNPTFSSIVGKGPGYWLERDSEGKEKSITNVWYHCNTILLYYGELGLLGLFITLMLPFCFFIETDNLFWGKTVKVLSIYLFMILFYDFPLGSLSAIIPLMVFFVYFRKFNYETKIYKIA